MFVKTLPDTGQHLLLQDKVYWPRLKLPPKYVLKIAGASKVILTLSPMHNSTSEGLTILVTVMLEQFSQILSANEGHTS